MKNKLYRNTLEAISGVALVMAIGLFISVFDSHGEATMALFGGAVTCAFIVGACQQELKK